MRPWLAATISVVMLASCTTSKSDVSRDQAAQAQGQGEGLAAPQPAAMPSLSSAAPGSIRERKLAEDVAVATAAGEQSSANANASPAADAAAPSMMIRTGNASIEVDTLEPAIAQLRQLTARLGAYIANSSLQDGKEQLRQASLEIKVPAERFDDLAAGLRPLGKVEYVNVNAEDVGEEYTDLTARVANARRLEERLIDLLASRTGKLQDVLAVERELARVRETIERYEGRLRYLKTRVAISTLVVTLHEPPPILTSNPGKNVIVEAFIRAWRNFVAVVATLIASLGVIAPLAALIVAAVFLWRHFRKP